MKVQTKCQKELEEDLIPAIAAIERSYFIDPNFRKPNIYVSSIDPPHIPRIRNLSKIEKDLKKDNLTCKQFERIQETYENNQNIYLQRFEQGRLTKSKLVDKLTELESWFVEFLEPPPSKTCLCPSIYIEELDQWLERVDFRKHHGFDKECPEEIQLYLDFKKLETSLDTRTKNYFKADTIYWQLRQNF